MKTSAYLNRVDGPAILTDVPVDRPERVDAVVGDKPFATPVLENPAPERLDPASLISPRQRRARYRLGGGCGGFGRRSILTQGVSGGCPAAKLFATPTFPLQVIGGQSI